MFSINKLIFVSWQSSLLLLIYFWSETWSKKKAEVLAKVKTDGHIWGLEFNHYVLFSFHLNCSIFVLRLRKLNVENSRSRSLSRSFWRLHLRLSIPGAKILLAFYNLYPVNQSYALRSLSKPVNATFIINSIYVYCQPILQSVAFLNNGHSAAQLIQNALGAIHPSH